MNSSSSFNSSMQRSRVSAQSHGTSGTSYDPTITVSLRRARSSALLQRLEAYSGNTSKTDELQAYVDRVTAKWSPFRAYAFDVSKNPWFSGSIFFVIVLNTILIALQTDSRLDVDYGFYFSVVDNVFLGIYTVEIVLKMYVWRRQFFDSEWNNFDLVIVILSIVEVVSLIVFGQIAAGLNPKIFRLLRIFRTLRAVRALRALRSVSFIKSLQIIVTTLLSSLPAMGSVFFLLFLVMYIFAIIGIAQYGKILPARFGNIWRALASLFQLITLDDWFTFYDEARSEDPNIIYFLIVYIIFETFILVNLFVAVIVSNLEESQKKNAKARRARKRRVHRTSTMARLNAIWGSRENEEERARMTEVWLNARSSRTYRQQQLDAQELMLLASLESNMEHTHQLHRVATDLADLAADKYTEGVRDGQAVRTINRS